MKIIDLLNKIANDEEVPKKIKYNDIIYKFRNDIGDYASDNSFLTDIFETTNVRRLLNQNVEIIEDTPKKIEKLVQYNDDMWHGITNEELLINKVNEVIDKLNYLLEKSDKE